MYPSIIYGSNFDIQVAAFRKEANNEDEVDFRVHAIEWAIAKNPNFGTLLVSNGSISHFAIALEGFKNYKGFLFTYSLQKNTVEFMDFRPRMDF